MRVFFRFVKPAAAGAVIFLGLSSGWVGAQEPAYLVKDALPGFSTLEGSKPRGFCQIGSITYFAAEGPGGVELYRTDGTESGTWRVKDINPLGSSSPQDLYNFNGTLFFTARSDFGRELWKSDGTEAGTVMVADINPAGSSLQDANIFGDASAKFTEYDGHLYFRASATLPDVGYLVPLQLFRTDGTAAGTVLVGGSLLQDVKDLAAAGGFLYVRNGSETSAKLWKSDGTDAGTELVAMSETPVYVKGLATVNDVLYFGAWTGASWPYDANLLRLTGRKPGRSWSGSSRRIPPGMMTLSWIT